MQGQGNTPAGWIRYSPNGTVRDGSVEYDILDFTEVAPRRPPGGPAPMTLKTGYVYEDREGRRYVIGQKYGNRWNSLHGTSTWAANGRVNDSIDFETRWDLVAEIGPALKDVGMNPNQFRQAVLEEGMWVTREGEKVRIRICQGAQIADKRPDFVATIHSKSVFYDAMGKAIEPPNPMFDVMHKYDTAWIKPVAGSEDPGDKKPDEAPKPQEEDTTAVYHEDLIQAVLRQETVQMKRPDGTWEDLRNRRYAITTLMTQRDKEFRVRPKQVVVWGVLERQGEHTASFTSANSEFQARTWANTQSGPPKKLAKLVLDENLEPLELKSVAP